MRRAAALTGSVRILGLGLYAAISSQFTLEVCTATENRKNIKIPYFEKSRSFKVINVNTAKKLDTSVCCDISDMSRL